MIGKGHRDLRGARGRQHVLRVAADVIAGVSGVSPNLVKELRKLEERVKNRNTPEDEQRIDRQRTLFNMLPSCNAADRLKEAMLQRAYDLLWDGDCDGCDALIEFLPSDDVQKMLNAWSDDQEGKQPPSRWY